MSTSQGRELIQESLRLLAWNADTGRKRERERRDEMDLRSVTGMEKKSDGQGACERE